MGDDHYDIMMLMHTASAADLDDDGKHVNWMTRTLIMMAKKTVEGKRMMATATAGVLMMMSTMRSMRVHATVAPLLPLFQLTLLYGKGLL